MADVKSRGRFVWYELMTTDLEKAQAFYTKVVGWGTQAWPGPQPYTMWTADGAPLGGLMKQPQEEKAPPHWLAYISTPDVDATTKQAQSLGATVLLKPTPIPQRRETFSVLADPGRRVRAFRADGRDAEPQGPPPAGQFSWHELMTTDYKAAFAFYNALFGWGRTPSTIWAPWASTSCSAAMDINSAGCSTRPPSVPAPPNWLQYVAVDSADRAAERVTANGGTIMNGPMDVPGGDRIAQCMDPQGAAFAVHSRQG